MINGSMFMVDTIGWQVCMTEYRRKILSTLASMKRLLETARVPNRVNIRGYLDLTRDIVMDMIQPLHGDPERLFLLPRFQVYMDKNEARLQKGLETVKYQIDAFDTLALINGRKGLERVCLHLKMRLYYDDLTLLD